MLEHEAVDKGVFPEGHDQGGGQQKGKKPGDTITAKQKRQRDQEQREQAEIVAGLGKAHPPPVIGFTRKRHVPPLLAGKSEQPRHQVGEYFFRRQRPTHPLIVADARAAGSRASRSHGGSAHRIAPFGLPGPAVQRSERHGDGGEKQQDHDAYEQQIFAERPQVGAFFHQESGSRVGRAVGPHRKAGVEGDLPVHVEELEGEDQGRSRIMEQSAATKRLFQTE